MMKQWNNILWKNNNGKGHKGGQHYRGARTSIPKGTCGVHQPTKGQANAKAQ